MVKRNILFVLLIVSALFSLGARENYYYEDYKVDVVLSEDGTMHYSEDILVNFTSPMHGIYRDIKYYFDEADPFYPIIATVDNIKVENGDSPHIEKGDGYISIRFGSADKYVEGPVRYTFSYDFYLGPDRYEEYDEFYQNMLSAQNDFEIKNFHYSLTLPKQTDLNGNLFVTYGQYGSTNQLKPVVSSDGLKISGSLKDLKPYDAVTVRVEFPEGYYVQEPVKDKTILFKSASVIISLLLLFYAYNSYRHYGIDSELVSPVRFKAPDGVNPLDADYLLNRSLNGSRDTLSMLFYWADRGYVTIEDSGKDDFSITAIKQLEEGSASEKELYRIMFGSSFPKTVTIKDLGRKNLPVEFQTKLYTSITKSYTKDRALFDSTSRSKRVATLTLAAFSVVLSSVAISARYLGLALVFALAVYGFNFVLISILANRYTKRRIEGKRAIGSIIAAAIFSFIFILIAISLNSIFGPEWLGLIHGIVTSISLVLTIFIGYATERRSDFYTSSLEAIHGYKDFIKTVEENKLKVMIDEDPGLFYHTLSYAVVFGLAKEWTKKFKEFYVTQPSWYNTPSAFDYLLFMSIADRWDRAYKVEMVKYMPSVPSGRSGGASFTSSGSSGFAGGGFSGGGSRGW